MASNVVNIDDYNNGEDYYEEMLHCPCGSTVFFLSLKDGLVCLDCDGKIINYVMKEVTV